MTQRDRVLRLYQVGLRLYPKHFQKEYADQMLLTAQDLLAEAQSKSAITRLSIVLAADLARTLMQENAKHIGGSMKKSKTTKKPALRAATLGAQIVGIGVMAFVAIVPILTFFPAPRDQIGGFVNRLVPVVFLLAAAVIMRREPKLSAWSKTLRTFGWGFAGMLFYTGLYTAIGPFSYFPADFWQDWLLSLACCVIFYLVVARIVRRQRSNRVRMASK